MRPVPFPVVDPAAEAGAAAQIHRHFALLIADGRLVAGDRLPAVRDAASRVGVSINTVRAAYARLEADGLVELHPDRLVVTPIGRLMVRNIAMAFDAWLERGPQTFSRTI